MTLPTPEEMVKPYRWPVRPHMKEAIHIDREAIAKAVEEMHLERGPYSYDEADIGYRMALRDLLGLLRPTK